MTTRRFATAALMVSMLLVACGGGSGAPPPSSSAPTSSAPASPAPVSPVSSPPVGTTASPVAPPSPPATPFPTSGPATTDCVNGWVTPAKGSTRYLQPLGIIRRTSGVKGPLVVMDMRYFEGPESPLSDQGYLLVVQRWYVRLYAKDDPAFQGRFLVEARRFGRGLSAVARFDSHGWASPDWIGFQFESQETRPKPYPGLPGAWEGTPYDFVRGGGGVTFPGLPTQLVGCLDGT